MTRRETLPEGPLGDAVRVFARPVPRRIAQTLLARPLDRRELRSRMGCADSTLVYHLDKLVRLGYIVEDADRVPRRYGLADPALIGKTLRIFVVGPDAADMDPPEETS